MYTLPHGHPTGTRVSGGAKAESEVESATISASADGPAETKPKTRRKTAAKQVQPPEKETVEVDSTGSAKDPTDKPEE